MTANTLRLTRNILLRSFVVGVGFTLLASLVTYAAWDTWSGLVTKLAHADQATLAAVMLNFFAVIKGFLVFGVLTPALAIHWTIKQDLSGQEGTGAQGKIQAEIKNEIQNEITATGRGNIAPQH